MSRVTKSNQSKINAYIMALYIFQFGLLQPLASIVNSQWPVAGFSLALLFGMLINNNFRIKKYVVLVLLIVNAYWLINILALEKAAIILLPLYIEFIFKSISAFMIGSLDINGDELYDAFLKMSVINFFAIILFPFIDLMDSMNYMRFGYAMAPSVIMFFYAAINHKSNRILWVLLLMAGFAITVIYGSRGSLLVFFIAGLALFIFTKSISKIRKSLLLVCAGFIIIMGLKYGLLLKLVEFINLEIGGRSYALNKLTVMLSVDIAESSSGRDTIYAHLISFINKNPFIGYGVGASQRMIGSTAHNMLLQILLEAGLIGLLIWMLVWIYCIRNYRTISDLDDIGLFQVVTLIGALAVGRLLVSSDMWLRPEYWFVLSMLINAGHHRRWLQQENDYSNMNFIQN